jgi:O-antigen/teichoic acid export membrane protein
MMVALGKIQDLGKQVALLPFFRKGISMAFWQGVTLLLTFGSTVWIARSLGPSELGKSGFIIATNSQILLLLAVCPNAYAVRFLKERENSKEAISIIFTARALVGVVYSLLVLGMILLDVFPSEWKPLILLGFMIPVLIAIQPVWLLQSQENQAAQFKMSAAIAFTSMAIALLFIRPGGIAEEDLAARLGSVIVGAGVGWWLVGSGNPFRFFRMDKLNLVLRSLWESRVVFFTQLVVYIYVGLELPLIGYLTDLEELGLYRSSIQLVAAANSFLVMVPMLYYPKFIEWRKSSPALLWQNQKKILKYVLMFVLPVAAGTFLLGPYLYGVVFGEQFQSASYPFAVLLCSKLVVLIHGIFAWGLYANNKDTTMLYILVLVALVSLTSNLVFIPNYGMIAAAWVNLTSESLILGLCYFASRKLIRGKL